MFCLFETGGLRHASGDDGGEPGRDRRRAARRGRTGRAIVGMTYYNVFAPSAIPMWMRVSTRSTTCWSRRTRRRRWRSRTSPAPSTTVSSPPSAGLVCAWTWFCSDGDVHLNTAGYGSSPTLTRIEASASQQPTHATPKEQPVVSRRRNESAIAAEVNVCRRSSPSTRCGRRPMKDGRRRSPRRTCSARLKAVPTGSSTV